MHVPNLKNDVQRLMGFIPEPTSKEKIRYFHHQNNHFPKSTVPPPTFASTLKKPYFPNDLWKQGTLIYKIGQKGRCLPPPTDKSDKILRFDSNFESGNLDSAYQISHDIYHCILQYDNNQSGSAQWFYFKITNARSNAKYVFYISGFHKNTGVYNSGSKIFWYSEKQARRTGITWSRGGSGYAYGITKKDKNNGKRSTLHFQISFPYDDDEIFICYAVPYTYSNLLRAIGYWQKQAPAIFHTETLCQSFGGRNCPVITITSKVGGLPESKRKCIFFTARMHPGESNGSIMLHGFIDFIIGNSPEARFLLDHYIIKIVPMICIDGVIEGFYRISLSGYDLNRVWTNPDPVLHPVVFHTKNLMKQIQEERGIAYYIDFHGHSRLHGTFAYGCPNADDDALRDSEKTLAKVLAAISEDFSWGRCVFSFPEGRKSAGRIVVRKELGVVQSFTIESSFGGCAAGPRAGLLYDECRWRKIGINVGEALYIVLSNSDAALFANIRRAQTETKKDRKLLKSQTLNSRNSSVLLRSKKTSAFIAASNKLITTSRASRIGLA